jgi:hypothetical protein
MDDLTKLFDGLLVNIAAYPVTIWNLLFHPLQAFQPSNSEWNCSPSLTYVFTIMISYLWWQGQSLRSNHKLPDWINPKSVTAAAVAYVATIVNVQQYAVSRIIGIADCSLKYRLEAFVYAFCPMLLLTVLVTAAGWFDINSKMLFVAFPVVHSVYLVGLYNVSLAAFHLSSRSALWAAFLAWGCFMGVVVPFSLVFLMVERRATSKPGTS